MSNKIIDTAQGHWLLAKMGKKVLRPGGKDLTLKLIKALSINSGDRVVEFAPVVRRQGGCIDGGRPGHRGSAETAPRRYRALCTGHLAVALLFRQV